MLGQGQTVDGSGEAHSGEYCERGETRTILLFKAAAISSRHLAGLCVIKNISTGGAMIKTCMSLLVGDSISLELACGASLQGKVRWRQDDLYGLRFDSPVDISTVLANGVSEQGGKNARRTPRLLMSIPIRLQSPQGIVDATTVDVSTHGMRVTSDRPIAVGRATVWLPNMAATAGRVLWVADRQAGCVFDRPFRIDDLTAWSSMIQGDGKLPPRRCANSGA